MSLVALGVTGSIGAYKAVEIARLLQKAGHDVTAVMTRNARRFVGPLTFESITRRPVITSQWKPGTNANVEHIEIASAIDLLLVAPATANIIGKFAHGIADDFLSALYLATRAPVLIAPAMNTNMLEHPAVGENVETLVKRGARFVEPGEGFLACGWVGKGRLAEPEEIVAAAESILRPATSLRGRRVLVTAGPTCEDLDPVRYLGNRSSGRMGFAVAAEAVRRGADVTLVSGPTAIDPPQGTEVVRVRSAAEMHRAVTAQAFSCDAVVMAAAVADYTPETVAEGKLTKRDEPLLLRLAPTRDILGDLGAERARRAARLPVLVGFAAETADLVSRARQKLQGKQLDLVVGNDVSQEGAGFDVATNAVTLVDAGGELALPRQPKAQVARAILDRVEALLSEAGGPQALPPRADGGQASAAERT